MSAHTIASHGTLNSLWSFSRPESAVVIARCNLSTPAPITSGGNAAKFSLSMVVSGCFVKKIAPITAETPCAYMASRRISGGILSHISMGFSNPSNVAQPVPALPPTRCDDLHIFDTGVGCDCSSDRRK